MADDSLNDDAGTRQSNKQVTFCLTFTQAQWFAFWRMLIVGCSMSDQLLQINAEKPSATRAELAAVWKQLSEDFGRSLETGKVKYQEVTKTA